MEATFNKFAAKLSAKPGVFDPAMIIAILMALLPMLCPTPKPADIKAQAANPGFRLRAKGYRMFLESGMSVRQTIAAFNASMEVLAEAPEEEVAEYLTAAQS